MTNATKHFPKKGERLVNGEWVTPTPPKPVRLAETARDRLNYLRKQAGWPPLTTK